MSYSHIDAILKAYFDFMSKQEPYAMAEPGEIIPESMIDGDRPLQDDDCLVWKPIESTVTESELVELETFFGHALPGSYRHFLQQFHFVAVYLDQNNLSFFPSFPGQLVSGTQEIVTRYYADLPKRHLLPFAYKKRFRQGFVPAAEAIRYVTRPNTKPIQRQTKSGL